MLDDPTNNLNSAERIAVLRTELSGTVGNLREGIPQVEDPRAKALLETSAEVLEGLVKAFGDYEHRSEPAWR